MRDIALPHKKTEPRKSDIKKWKVLLWVGGILTLIGLIFGFMPNFNSYGVWLAIIAIAIGLFGVLKKFGKTSKILLVAALVALMVSIISVAIQNNAEWSAQNDLLERKNGTKTQYLLDNDVEVTFSEYADDGVTVSIFNKNPESKFYSVWIVAKNEDGSAIDKQMVDLGGIISGGKKEITIFGGLDENRAEAMKSAKFEVTKVSQY